MNTEQWRQTRFIAYCSAKPYFEKKDEKLTVFEFMPLPGDPSPEEIVQYKKEFHTSVLEDAEAALKEYRKKRLNV